MCSAKSLGNNTLSCNVGFVVLLQSGLELIEGTGWYQQSMDPHNTEVSS